MNSYTPEQLRRADSKSLVDYLLQRGFTLEKKGPQYLVSELSGMLVHDNEWFSYYKNRGGKTLSFLTEFFNMPLQDAVRELTGEEPLFDPDRIYAQKEHTAKAVFRPDRMMLPVPNENNDTLIRSLRCMGISMPVILSGLKNRYFYESSFTIEKSKTGEYLQFPSSPNIIFLGYDQGGAAACAFSLSVSGGTPTVVPGSDLVYGFRIPSEPGPLLYVFDDPLSLLGHLGKENLPAGHRVSLSCGDLSAVEQALTENPGVRFVRSEVKDKTLSASLRLLLRDYPVVDLREPDWEKNFRPADRIPIYQPPKETEKNMPNHITNVLQFDCSVERFTAIAESVRSDGDFFGSVDFNKLLPMPQSLDIEAGSRGERGLKDYMEYRNALALASTEEEKNRIHEKYSDSKIYDPQCMELGKQYAENIEKYGAPHWYDWCTEHWGTKWNAYDCREAVPEDRSLTFHTAWSAVPEITQKLSERFPEETIRYRWADEDIGFNVGEAEFKNGRISSFSIPEPGSKEAYELSAAISGLDLADFGFFPDEKNNTYVYDEQKQREHLHPSGTEKKEHAAIPEMEH